jgi:vacuolar-type H+-ATPase catalytic subunit A/Vma1
MDYIVVKVAGESDIMGRLVVLDEQSVSIQDPVYVFMKPTMRGGLSLGMTRATMLSDNHNLELDLNKVLTYYYPSSSACEYYEEVIETYREFYDKKFTDTMEADEEPEEQEDSELMQRIKDLLTPSESANTVLH